MNTEQIHNLMTLSIQVQHYWDSAICAFRPIRVNEEKTSMEIAFHWLPLPLTDVTRAELVSTQKHPYPDQRQGFGYSSREDGPMFLFHRETRQEIPSGYIYLHCDNIRSRCSITAVNGIA
jgi:hypothetical protein